MFLWKSDNILGFFFWGRRRNMWVCLSAWRHRLNLFGPLLGALSGFLCMQIEGPGRVSSEPLIVARVTLYLCSSWGQAGFGHGSPSQWTTPLLPVALGGQRAHPFHALSSSGETPVWVPQGCGLRSKTEKPYVAWSPLGLVTVVLTAASI